MRERSLARPSMPQLGAIALAWADHPELVETFPGLKAHAIGWGEPCCFRCGWLTPTKEACEYPTQWKAGRKMAAAWNAAAGWLERAHLHDHAEGGDSEPLNLVPLCPICHQEQPVCEDREQGVAYVNSPSRFAGLLPFAQIFTDGCYHGKPGTKGQAERALLRAFAEVGQVIHAEHPKVAA